MRNVSISRLEHLENLPSYRYPVEDLLKELAEVPPPGACGAASWLCAIAAALVAKVARMTIGREGFEPVEEEMRRILSRATTIGDQSEELIDQDPTMMNRLATAAALPLTTPEEQEIRHSLVQSALKNAAQVPMLIAQNGREIFNLAESVFRYGVPGGATEAILAVRTAVAAIDGALLAGLAKASKIEDEAFTAELREKAIAIRSQVKATETALMDRAMTRHLLGSEGLGASNA